MLELPFIYFYKSVSVKYLTGFQNSKLIFWQFIITKINIL